MSEKLPELPAHFTRTNDRGLIEVVDMHTGRILCVQATPRDLLQAKFDRLTRIDTPEGPVWIEKGLNFDLIKHLESVPYSKLLGDLICEDIVNGKSLKTACEKLNLKYSTVVRWRRDNPEFAEELKMAEKERAIALHDEVLDVARDENTANKTKIAALQWAAEKADPEKYGTKTKIVGDKDAPVTFVLQTGIQRPGDNGYEAPQTVQGEVLEKSRVVEEAGDEALEAYSGGKE